MPSAGASKISVIVELRLPHRQAEALSLESLKLPGFKPDLDYPPIPSSPPPELAAELASANEELVIVRGRLDPKQKAKLEANPMVYKVWQDTPIAPLSV
jgi:hypothetical protein